MVTSSIVLQKLVTPGFRAGVYAGNALWHSMAFANFTFRPEYMLKKLTTRSHSPETKTTPGGDAWHQDVVRYLGAINAGYAALALLRFVPLIIAIRGGPQAQGMSGLAVADRHWESTLDVITLSALGIANASQAICNFVVARPSGRWIVGHWRGAKTDRITLLDSLFTILDFGIVGARLAGF